MGLVAKAFQDIITFSRASSGTYVNSSGYITNSSVLNYLTYSNQPENAAWTKSNSFVQQNLFLYSQEFDNVNWGTLNVATPTANTTIAPDGTLTADTVTASAGTASRNISQSSGGLTLVPMTTSVYAKANTLGFLQIFHGSASSAYANFNLITGAVGTVGAVTAAMTSAGNGWYRCSITFTPSAASNIRLALISSATAVYNESWAAAGTESIFLWGAQVVQGSVPGDYRATTTLALPTLYPDYTGALRARKLCENNVLTTHEATQNVATNASTYTFFEDIKAGERTFAMLYHGTSNAAQVIDLSTGSPSGNAGLSAPVSYSIVNKGNGWWRLSITVNATAATNNFRVYPMTNATTYSYTGDGSSGIYIADAQLNDGSSALAYYDTSASAYNAPRFDYDPVTLAAKGLLVEEQRANFLIRSSDFSNSVWNNASPNIPTVTTDATLSPDGTVNADLLTAATGGTACQARQPGATGTTGNFTASVFLKVGSATRNRILLTDHTSVFTVVGDFQVAWTAGVASVFSTASGTASVVAAGNGWYRCVVTASTASANAVMGIAIFPDPVAGTGSVYAWQAQVEAGAFATSVIPTVASQVTRAADVASVNTLSPWYNSVAGTLYAEWDYVGDGSTSNPNTRTTVGISDGTSNNRFQIYNISGNTGGLIQTGGVTQAALDAGATTAANTIVKGALAYATNDAAYSRNGGAPSTDVSVTLPTVNVMYLGTEPAAQRLSGHLRRITYYPRRLTNAELQTLTTL